MGKVVVKNSLESPIKIQCGRDGEHGQLAMVQPHKECTLHLEKNATFREFVLIKLPDNQQVLRFSSDDIAEHSKIEIVMKEDSNSPEYDWRPVLVEHPHSGSHGGHAHNRSLGAETTSDKPEECVGWFHWFRDHVFFRKT